MLGQSRNKQTQYLQASSPCDSSESFCYNSSSTSLSNCTSTYCRYPVWAKMCCKKKKAFIVVHLMQGLGVLVKPLGDGFDHQSDYSRADSKKKNVRSRSKLRKSGSCWARQLFANLSTGSFLFCFPALAPPEESNSFGTRGASSTIGRWKDGLYIVCSWEDD